MSGVLKINSEEFAAALKEVRRHYPDEAEKELRHLGNDLKKKAVERTPEGKDHSKHPLKKSYHLSATKQAGDTLYIEFRSDSPHFHLVERGHAIKDRNGKEHGFVPGVHMVQNSLQEVDEEMPGELEGWMEKMAARYGL